MSDSLSRYPGPKKAVHYPGFNGVGAAKLKEFAVPFLAAIAAAPAEGDDGGASDEGPP